jgi:hypothetical protein
LGAAGVPQADEQDSGHVRSGQTEQQYVQQFGEPLTPEVAGAALVELVRADAATVAPAYLLTSAGPQTPTLTEPTSQ